WQQHVSGEPYDVVFSPGVNCFDADVVSVHIVFAEYAERNRDELRLSRRPLRAWPALLHRKAYYSLIKAFEKHLYTNPDLKLVLIARRTGDELSRFYGRHEEFPLVYIGLDHTVFNRSRQVAMRDCVRKELSIPEDDFVLLLIGNDWRNKGAPVILEA